jgi:hypothetical protein
MTELEKLLEKIRLLEEIINKINNSSFILENDKKAANRPLEYELDKLKLEVKHRSKE